MKRAAVFGIAVHGGAGDGWLSVLKPAGEKAVHAAIARAVEAGHGILRKGGTAVDAAVAAVARLEDSPLFNAGRGAARNRDGDCELDAAVMDGANRGVGAIAGVRRVRNPVLLARAVMERSGNVFLVGPGAERFAATVGVELVEQEYFKTPGSLREWRLAMGRADGKPGGDTVGAVALDRDGNLASATSTGGVAGKRPGRVGDGPIVGAGTFADNSCCAVTMTGYGEHFVRTLAAHEVALGMQYRKESVDVASKVALEKVLAIGGMGGVLALDANGRVAAPFSPAAMPRGWRIADRKPVTLIWKSSR